MREQVNTWHEDVLESQEFEKDDDIGKEKTGLRLSRINPAETGPDEEVLPE